MAEEVTPAATRRTVGLRRRRAGIAMLVVAAAGLITSLSGVVVGWRLVGQVERTVDDSLVLTADALTTLDETIVVADEIIGSVGEGLVVAEESIGTSADSFETANLLIADLDELTAVLAPGLTDAATTLDELARTGALIDAFLDDVSSIPFAPNYSGDLGGSLGDLADDIAPLADAVEAAGNDLGALQGDADVLQSDLRRLERSIASVNESLSTSESVLTSYRAQAGEASALAAVTREDLASEVSLTRAFVVAAGLVSAMAQIVPLWMGLEILGEVRRDESSGSSAQQRV